MNYKGSGLGFIDSEINIETYMGVGSGKKQEVKDEKERKKCKRENETVSTRNK